MIEQVTIRRRGREAVVVRGRTPYVAAAVTLIEESGVHVSEWRRNATGIARTTTDEWVIEAPRPTGPVAFAVLAHEVGHQLLHRSGSRPRWVEEWEAWEYALDAFDRFDLPGRERVLSEAAVSMDYALGKAWRRIRTVEGKRRLVLAARELLPPWLIDGMGGLPVPEEPIRVEVRVGDRLVWTFDEVGPLDLVSAACPTNRRGSALVSGLRRAVEDADAIRRGLDPERPSEKAMRLAAEMGSGS